MIHLSVAVIITFTLNYVIRYHPRLSNKIMDSVTERQRSPSSALFTTKYTRPNYPMSHPLLCVFLFICSKLGKTYTFLWQHFG